GSAWSLRRASPRAECRRWASARFRDWGRIRTPLPVKWRESRRRAQHVERSSSGRKLLHKKGPASPGVGRSNKTLKQLADAWRKAAEIASISDDLFPPNDVSEHLANIKN